MVIKKCLDLLEFLELLLEYFLSQRICFIIKMWLS